MAFSGIAFTAAVSLALRSFTLDTDTPDALCPELGKTRNAVERRLGQLDVSGGGHWQGRYHIVHDPAGRRGDYLVLSITDPEGQEQLKRELAIDGASCATLEQAIALVVDGFFRDLGQPPTQPAPVPKEERTDSGSVRQPVTLPAAIPKAPVPQIPAPTPQHHPEANRLHLGWVAGGGFESMVRAVALGLGGFLAMSSSLRITLYSAVPLTLRTESVAPWTAHLYAIPSRLALTRTIWRSSDLSVGLGPESLLSIERGWTEGLVNKRTGYRAVLGLGGQLAVTHSLSSNGGAALRVSVDYVPYTPPRFSIEEQTVLLLPDVRWAASIDIWNMIF